MKKLLLLCLIFVGLSVNANEMIEDYFDIASNYCLYGKYKDAINYVDKIIAIDPYNADARELKQVLIRATNPKTKSYLNITEQKINEAYLAKKSGDENAQLKALSGNDFWSNYFSAQYYRDKRDFDKSVFYFQKAIQLRPNYSQSYLGLAKAYIGQKNYQNAIENLDKYLSYNRNADIAYALKAEANMNLKNLAEAQKDIKKAINIEESISYLLIEAKILYYQGYYDDAREKLTLLSRNIQTSEVYKYIGLCDYAQKDYPNALLNLDKAIILFEDDKSLISTYNNVKEILSKEYEEGNTSYKN